eukprot:CAMPEP_0178439334 /NCGR_PEP_ID=MMETSP0689_2-20121128/36100_1 /TAXON_ID=160604 /ORGANISM="Amphidinium massartii, Strain CS-259" /LENGTH=332 /DNA_ID=CAMNT_0020061855 /DNA_START=13 /DNA_END=1008 /DNA_ORIENTATION=-
MACREACIIFRSSQMFVLLLLIQAQGAGGMMLHGLLMGAKGHVDLLESLELSTTTTTSLRLEISLASTMVGEAPSAPAGIKDEKARHCEAALAAAVNAIHTVVDAISIGAPEVLFIVLIIVQAWMLRKVPHLESTVATQKAKLKASINEVQQMEASMQQKFLAMQAAIAAQSSMLATKEQELREVVAKIAQTAETALGQGKTAEGVVDVAAHGAVDRLAVAEAQLQQLSEAVASQETIHQKLKIDMAEEVFQLRSRMEIVEKEAAFRGQDDSPPLLPSIAEEPELMVLTQRDVFPVPVPMDDFMEGFVPEMECRSPQVNCGSVILSADAAEF